MIGPQIGEGPRQCDFLFGAYKDQRPIISQEKRGPVAPLHQSHPRRPPPRQQRQNVGNKLHIFIVRSPLRGPTKPQPQGPMAG